MNKSNIRFLSLASISLFVGLTPLACGSDDDDDSTSTAGKTSGGTSGSAGKNSTGGTAGKNGSGGSISVAGDASGGTAGNGGEGGAAATTARLRIVHASPNAPSIDIYPKGSTTAVLEGFSYGEASDFLDVDAGTMAF